MPVCRLTLEECDQLTKKVPFLLRAIRAARHVTNAGALCEQAREAYKRATTPRTVSVPSGASLNALFTHATSVPYVPPPEGSYSCQMPVDCWGLSGLFSIIPVSDKRPWNNATEIGAALLTKLTLDPTFSADGTAFDVVVNRGRWPLRLTLDELEDLCVKLPYLLARIERANDSDAPTQNAEELCLAARRAYAQETQFATLSQGLGPVGSQPSSQCSSQSSCCLSLSSGASSSSAANSPRPKRLAL